MRAPKQQVTIMPTMSMMTWIMAAASPGSAFSICNIFGRAVPIDVATEAMISVAAAKVTQVPKSLFDMRPRKNAKGDKTMPIKTPVAN